MANFKLNKTGQSFIETQNRKIKLTIPTFIFISIVVAVGIYLKLGLDITSVTVMIVMIGLNYYINIQIARNKATKLRRSRQNPQHAAM